MEADASREFLSQQHLVSADTLLEHRVQKPESLGDPWGPFILHTQHQQELNQPQPGRTLRASQP